jgi:hypothetical protein
MQRGQERKLVLSDIVWSSVIRIAVIRFEYNRGSSVPNMLDKRLALCGERYEVLTTASPPHLVQCRLVALGIWFLPNRR